MQDTLWHPFFIGIVEQTVSPKQLAHAASAFPNVPPSSHVTSSTTSVGSAVEAAVVAIWFSTHLRVNHAEPTTSQVWPVPQLSAHAASPDTNASAAQLGVTTTGGSGSAQNTTGQVSEVREQSSGFPPQLEALHSATEAQISTVVSVVVQVGVKHSEFSTGLPVHD
jgi:hypothetical protein